MKRSSLFFWCRPFIFLLFVSACSENKSVVKAETSQNIDLTHLNFTVEEAPEWTNLFNRTSGWFGADGIFAIPKNGVDKLSDSAETVLLFSDTMIGEIEDGKPKAIGRGPCRERV